MVAFTVVSSACVALYGGGVSVDQTALAFVSDDPNLLPQQSSVLVYCLFGCIPRLFLRSCYILLHQLVHWDDIFCFFSAVINCPESIHS